MKVSVAIHKEGKWYVAIDPVTGVASQGKSMDEALKNFQEAFELWFENAEEWEKEGATKSTSTKRNVNGDLYFNTKQ
jgi:predicted RNase H-like HicB family nuclease